MQLSRRSRPNRVLKNRASGRDPALCGYCKCSHITEYAALSKIPHALADGLMLVFQHPAESKRTSLRPPHVSRVLPMRLLLSPLVFIGVAVLALSLGGCAALAESSQSKAPPPGAVTGMHHVLLTVADLPRSVQFYRDVLGMQLNYSTANFAMLRAGSFGVALSTHPWEFEKKGEPKGIGMIPHFTTANMDEFAARLRENGVSWLRAPVRESFGIEAFIIDPDGYQWAVLAPLKP